MVGTLTCIIHNSSTDVSKLHTIINRNTILVQFLHQSQVGGARIDSIALPFSCRQLDSLCHLYIPVRMV